VVDWNWSGALLGLKLQKRLDDLTVWKTALQTRKGSKTPTTGWPPGRRVTNPRKVHLIRPRKMDAELLVITL